MICPAQQYGPGEFSSSNEINLGPIEVTQLCEGDVESILSVFNEALGGVRSAEWFEWKHLENPCGASLGWCGWHDKRLVSVRLFLKWELVVSGKSIAGLRPVDSATLPSMQGRGLFTHLTQLGLEAAVADPNIGVLFNTPNSSSQGIYRKLGWNTSRRIRASVFPTLIWTPAKLVCDDLVYSDLAATDNPADAVRTQKSEAYLNWRYDSRSGHQYETARLAQSEQPNGIVFRVAKAHGMRIIVVCELSGDKSERKVLVQSAARSVGAVASVLADSPTEKSVLRGIRVKSGCSTVAVRSVDSTLRPLANEIDWELSMGDLEGCI